MTETIDWQSRAHKLEALIVRLHDNLEGIVMGIEDEGDRSYFGSTNDADQLKEIWQKLDDLAWLKILRKVSAHDR